MKKPQFKGYVLEYVLAYILQSSGYTIIDVASRTDPDITSGRNGLNIQGRGTKHQIDVIGNLEWVPAFTYPIRLLIEAKFRGDKIGVDIVREQIGILSDINENYFSVNPHDLRPRYRYVSAIFSTSGFSKSAIDLAIAHQIQLIDMSDDVFSDILNAIDNFTEEIFSNQQSLTKGVVRSIREVLKDTLFNNLEHSLNNQFYEKVVWLKNEIDTFRNKVFIGMTQSGFMLLLYAKNGDFLRYAQHHKVHDIVIHWSNSDNGKLWKIQPVNDNDKYVLVFKLPKRLHDWIYRTSRNIFDTAIDEKQRHFSKISIYYKDDYEILQVFTLKFNVGNLNNEGSNTS